MGFKFKTISGCNRKIESLKQSIQTYKRKRGSTDGLFWQDVKAVDQAILEMELDIIALVGYKENLNANRNEYLITVLKSSEIF